VIYINWFRFFFGTPRRFLATLVAIIVLAGFSAIFPGVIRNALVGLGQEILGSVASILTPFIYPMAVFVIILLGIKIMLSGLRGKKKS